MKRSIFTRERRSPKTIAISLAIEAVLIAALASVTFHYQRTVSQHETMNPERIHFITVATPAPGLRGNGLPAKAVPVPKVPPPPTQQVIPPTQVPVGIPTAPPLVAPPASAGVTSGVQGGTGTAATSGSITTGIEPALPDQRIPLAPTAPTKTPRTNDFRVDSAIKANYDQYRLADSLAKANPNRKPGDWTVGKDGNKWGWDQNGFELGKFTIPNALLSLFKFNVPMTGSMGGLVQGHASASMAQDLRDHQQGIEGMPDDDIQAMQKRMRAVADQQKAQQQLRAATHGRDSTAHDTTLHCCQR